MRLVITCIVRKRQSFSLVAYSQYLSIFDGCYRNDIITNLTSVPYERYCNSYKLCFDPDLPYWEVATLLQNKSALVGGYNMNPTKIILNPNYKKKWIQLLDGVEANVSLWNVRKTMLRLILNPSRKLRKQLLVEKNHLLKLPHTIGLQLRMGGNISDTPEAYVGVPFSRLDEVLNQVRRVITKNQWVNQTQLYISSDSTKTIAFIREQTKEEFPVVESLLFRHGHTGLQRTESDYVNVQKKVVSDMYYMSICDHLIVTWPNDVLSDG